MSRSLSVSSLLFPIDIDSAKLDESDGDDSLNRSDDVNTVTDTTGPLSTVGHYQLQEPPLGSGVLLLLSLSLSLELVGWNKLLHSLAVLTPEL
jgi:hypothetical protein